ncbi:cysteine-rich receptor-like protein kinase, partial [Trifolium pratense]
ALLTDRCPIQKEAIGYYDSCILRYSHTQIFGVRDTQTSNVYYIEPKTVVEDAFKQRLNVLLDELKSTAADGDSRVKNTESPSPQPQSSETIAHAHALPPTTVKGNRRKLRTVIAIVVVVVAGILLIVAIAIVVRIYFERRKPRPQYTPEFEGT